MALPIIMLALQRWLRLPLAYVCQLWREVTHAIALSLAGNLTEPNHKTKIAIEKKICQLLFYG